MAVVPILFFVGFAIFIAIAGTKQAKQRAAMLAELGKRLGGGSVQRELRAWGEIAGTAVRFDLVTRGSGKSSTRWTEVSAQFPETYPLLFFVRKQDRGSERAITRGELVDVVVGEPRFDRKFVVEAAPADVARVLLHERAREYLLALEATHWFEIKTVGNQLSLEIQTWIETIEEAMAAVEAITSIASKVREAYVLVQQAAEVEDTGSPYRPMLDDTRARRAAEARLEEVRQLARLRIARETHQVTLAVVLVVGFVLFAIMAVAFAG